MGKKSAAAKPATTGQANKSKGIERPFRMRNLNRLHEMADNLRKIVVDFGRANQEDPKVKAALSIIGEIDAKAGELQAAVQSFDAAYTVAKPAQKNGAWLKEGASVVLTDESWEDYKVENVGPKGTVGRILEVLEQGVAVRFIGERNAFTRKAHLVKAPVAK